MNFSKIKTLLLLISCLAVSTHLCTQDIQSSSIQQYRNVIDSTAYHELVDQLDWSETKNALRLKEFEVSTETEEETERKPIKLGGSLFQILGYVAVIGLVGFILYLILGNIKFNPRIDKDEFEITPLDKVEDIDVIDAEQGLKDALSAGDYKLAFGMHYILILQKLAGHERINWQPSKTNRDYIREMRKDLYGKKFAFVSRSYDLSLYGDRTFGQAQYEALLPDLQLLTLPLIPVVDE